MGLLAIQCSLGATAARTDLNSRDVPLAVRVTTCWDPLRLGRVIERKGIAAFSEVILGAVVRFMAINADKVDVSLGAKSGEPVAGFRFCIVVIVQV